MMTKVKTPAEIVAMRASGRMLATVLELVQKSIKPGITTKELDTIAANELKKLGVEIPEEAIKKGTGIAPVMQGFFMLTLKDDSLLSEEAKAAIQRE